MHTIAAALAVSEGLFAEADALWSGRPLVTMRPPLPPFTPETAREKVRLAEDAWNSRDPERIALAYTSECRWRNRAEFLVGRPQIIDFLRRKWSRELGRRPDGAPGLSDLDL